MSLAIACGGESQLDGGSVDGGGVDAGPSPVDGGPSGEDGGGAGEDGGADDEDGGAVSIDAATELDGGECGTCIAETLRWELEGGFVAYQSASEVQPCRTYEHTRTPNGGGASTSCTNLVPCDGDGATIGALNAALAHDDVVAAFAAAPVLYGRDQRPVDGALFQITQGGATVSVGAPCAGGGPGGCVDIPPGVAALRELLTTLQGERLAEEDCVTTF